MEFCFNLKAKLYVILPSYKIKKSDFDLYITVFSSTNPIDS